MSFDGFSMRVLTNELKEKLCGGRIGRITCPDKNSAVIAVRNATENFLLHICVNSANPSAHIIEKNFENPPEPPLFCMVLRKQLEGGRIADIRQQGVDRLIIFDVDTLAGGGQIVTKTLIAELMGKYSNIILTKDGIIIDALKKIGNSASRVRTVLPNDEYVFPPAQDKIDLFAEDITDALEKLKTLPSEKLFRALIAVCGGFGPVTAKETAFIAHIPADVTVGELGEKDFLALKNALKKILQTPDEKKPTIVADENGKILGLSAFTPAHLLAGGAKASYFADCSSLMATADIMLKSYAPPDKDRFLKLVKNEIHRAEKKILVLQKELADAENADYYKIVADNLQTYRREINDHVKEATFADIYGSGQIRAKLDERLTVAANIQAYYNKYNKLKRARNFLEEQIKKCADETVYLRSVDTSLSLSATLADIAEIHDELAVGGYLKEKLRRKGGEKNAPLKFTAPNGMTVFAGKNNTQNDKLTFKIADRLDIWFHAKDMPGSHVILRTDRQKPAEDILVFAAKIAAYYSDGKNSSNVPVDYTECRYVKKPSGAKPGFVVFVNQKTMYVAPEAPK